MRPTLEMEYLMHQKFRRGFTLIELMIVVAIIAILAAIVYPSYNSSVVKAKRAEGKTALMQLMQQQERYYSQNSTYILSDNSGGTNPDSSKFNWFSGGALAASAYTITATATCTNDADLKSCVLLTATPNFVDPDVGGCGKLSLASTGAKAASGNATNCW